MVRYLRLFMYFLRFSFSKAMEFRLDFFFRIVMDLIFYAINFGFFKVIFLHTSLLGGWSESELMVFVAVFLTLDALNMTFLSNNLWMIPLMVNKGDLDYYLIRPVSSLFFLSLRDFAANSFVNLLCALAILVWALLQSGTPLTITNMAFLGIGILLGAVLRYLVRMVMMVPVFWMHSGRGFEMVFWHMTRFIERPHKIFTGAMRIVLTTILPFSLMASFPTHLFLEPLRWNILLHIVLVTVIFSIIVGILWKIGLRAYSSASS